MRGERFTLTIVSYPSGLEPLFEAAAFHLARAANRTHGIERAHDADELVYLVQLHHRRGYQLSRLDLFGHGDGGRFKLGDQLLFASDGTGYPVAAQVGAWLAPRAELRLLGCKTAHDARSGAFSGSQLLSDLEALLGEQRRVYGTRDWLRQWHWGDGGLTEAGEQLVTRATRSAPRTSPYSPRR